MNRERRNLRYTMQYEGEKFGQYEYLITLTWESQEMIIPKQLMFEYFFLAPSLEKATLIYREYKAGLI